MRRHLHNAAAAAAIAGLLAGCATTSGAPDTRTEVDRAIGKCVASVMVGAIVGGIVGNNSGNGNAGRGAAVGAAAGGAVCAVLLALASEKDRLLAEQQKAVAAGGLQVASYAGKDGLTRTVRTQTEDAPAAVAGVTRICRYATSEVELQGKGTASLGKQLYCRSEAGDWAPAAPEGQA